MVGWSKSLKIGVIAEEKNDVEVLYELTCKIIQENSFSFSHFVGHGCGKIRRKCYAWALNLLQRGCKRLVIIHDLDDRDEVKLREELEKAIKGLPFEQSVVLIPIEEIEAWLLADPEAIKRVFKMRRVPRIPARPEQIPNPKEFLGEIVKRNSRAHYLNTVHNRKIAAELHLESLDRCPSFFRYPPFLQT